MLCFVEPARFLRSGFFGGAEGLSGLNFPGGDKMGFPKIIYGVHLLRVRVLYYQGGRRLWGAGRRPLESRLEKPNGLEPAVVDE